MSEVHECFTDEFKRLWEPESKVRLVWDVLERLYSGLKHEIQTQSLKATAHRDLREIDADMRAAAKPME